MAKIKVFLDSDVIISALLSAKGASFELLENSNIIKFISESIKIEVTEVAKRLNISNFNDNIFDNINIVKINLDKKRIVKKYMPFVIDEEDSHVVAASHKTKVNFLLTHNIKHYRPEKIKDELKIITMKPGFFLQYLRSN